MGRKFLYRVPIMRRKKPASAIPIWNADADLFLPVNLATLAVIRAVLSYAIDAYWWEGTEQEIQTALEALHEQVSEPALHKTDICDTEPLPIGAWFRGIPAELQNVLLQGMMQEGAPPPPWEFRVIETEDGKLWQYRTQTN